MNFNNDLASSGARILVQKHYYYEKYLFSFYNILHYNIVKKYKRVRRSFADFKAAISSNLMNKFIARTHHINEPRSELHLKVCLPKSLLKLT
jgi:hypothetical protein